MIADKLYQRQEETHARPRRQSDLNVYEYKVARFTRGFSDPSGQAVIARRLGLVGEDVTPSQRSGLSGAVGAQGARPNSDRRIVVGGVAVGAQGARPNSSQRTAEKERQSKGPQEQPTYRTPPQRQGNPIPF